MIGETEQNNELEKQDNYTFRSHSLSTLKLQIAIAMILLHKGQIERKLRSDRERKSPRYRERVCACNLCSEFAEADRSR